MPELTLITNPPAAATTQADTQRPVPTKEFLARRVLALPFKDETIGAVLTEAAAYLEPDAADSRGRYSAISDALRLVGVWVWPPETEDDPPTHGVVVHPEKLVKRYPELARLTEELAGLQLVLPQSKA